jgi:hypothetical protein
MNTMRKISGVAMVVLGVGFIAVMQSHHQPQMISVPAKQETPSVAQTPVSVKPMPETSPVPQSELQPTRKPKTVAKTRVQNSAPARNNVKPGQEPLQDPDARDALAWVGVDPAAEQYWLDAIFDTSLPDGEREDLMEDLNETGFADPQNLTAEDVPLIVNRLEIINDVLPSADDFMTEHLMEAQKDLLNMYARVAQ